MKSLLFLKLISTLLFKFNYKKLKNEKNSVLYTFFNDTMIDFSFFQQIIIENIYFEKNFIFRGIKIQQGNASKIIMNSIQFKNINLGDYFFMFDSLDSNFIINDLYFMTFLYSKSKNLFNLENSFASDFNNKKLNENVFNFFFNSNFKN